MTWDIDTLKEKLLDSKELLKVEICSVRQQIKALGQLAIRYMLKDGTGVLNDQW